MNQTRLQVFIEINNVQKQDFFNKIQEFATIELKIQVLPVDNVNDLAQYVDRLVCFFIFLIILSWLIKFFKIQLVLESSNEVNLFSKQATINSSHNEFISSLKLIPKIGDKSAQQLAKTFRSMFIQKVL